MRSRPHIEEKCLRPDSKGRICLGKMAEGVSHYKAIVDEVTHKITLEPYVDIPLHEKWLFENEAALNSVKRGLMDSATGRVKDLGSFTKYAQEKEEEYHLSMSDTLKFTEEASCNLSELKQDSSLKKRLKAVLKSLAYLEINPKHPGLRTHKYETLSREFGEEVFEAYAENNTPQAYRIFWRYVPGKKIITIISITPHP